MKFGDIFSASWKEYKTNFKLYSKIILLFLVIPSIIVFLLNTFFFSDNPVMLFILSIVLMFITVLAVTSIYFSAVYKKTRFTQALGGGKRYYWRYILFILVAGLIWIGLTLLAVVPGIILWFLIGPVWGLIVGFVIGIPVMIALGIYWLPFGAIAIFADNKGIIGSLKISFKMIRHRWWKTFGYLILFGLIIILINLIFLIPSVPTWIMVFLDAFKNPSLYAQGAPATTILQIHNVISYIVKLLSEFVIVPLSILFIKNFYLAMKKK